MRQFSLFILLGFCCQLAQAQYSLKDFSLADTTTQWFDEQIGDFNNELLTGVYGQLAPIKKGNNPYFMAEDWNTGNIFYRGEEFTNIKCLYNVFDQEFYVYFKKPTTYLSLPIRLYLENLDWFETEGHLFVNYRTGIPNRPAGIYHQIFKSSRLELLERKQKIKVTENTAIAFQNYNWFRLCIDGNCEPVKGRRRFKKTFPNHKKQLRKFWKEHRIIFLKKADFQQLKILGALCDTFIN